MTQCSTLLFHEGSRVRAGNYVVDVVDTVDAVFRMDDKRCSGNDKAEDLSYIVLWCKLLLKYLLREVIYTKYLKIALDLILGNIHFHLE